MSSISVNFSFSYRISVAIFILSYFSGVNAYFYLDERPCGTLYSEINHAGQQYKFNDREQSINLPEDLHVSEFGWNYTGSIKIESGCSMEICNETYFDGECETLKSGNYPIITSSLKLSDVASVSCSCVKQCKCSDIFMKRSTCARAYLQGGCSTCHSLYTDLDKGYKDYFPDDFVGKVEALRLRKGCTLTAYSEEYLEGEQEIIESEIVENYNGTIGSYECECREEDYIPKPIPPRPTSYPPLVDVPGTLDEVLKMIANPQYSNHPGLQAAMKSLKHKRSSRNAYILLLGTTGAGKSSAINLLFDNENVTKVGEDMSTTQDIHEFRIPVPVDELGIANSELRVIDTPGLGDTGGVDRDSKFLATLDNYLSNHEELKDKIPNVVLIFHKFHDNRFAGPGSQFVQMLRGFDSFRERITDDNYSNVIFVMSHFMSESKEYKRRPQAKLARFKQTINDFTLFPKPIIITVAENKAKSQELPMVNGYFKLPNNEYYPRNLFEKMELVTSKSGDLIGMGVFRTAFRDSDGFNVSSTTFRILPKGSHKVAHYLRILSNSLLGVKKTEISQLLQQAWDSNVVDTRLRMQFPNSLQYLQKALNMRNVNTREDLPQTSTQILQLLTAIKHDEATRILLEKALNIKAPAFPQNTIVGFSYDVFKDTHLPTSPFKLGDLQQSDIGFMIPKVLTCKLDPGEKEIFEVLDNKEKYIEHRLQSLGIEGAVSNNTFTGKVKPGHNIKELSFKPDSCTLSATREIRLFELVLNNRLDLTNEFKTTVKRLPAFNESDHGNVEQWRAFFNEYGTHVVKSVYGGGAIKIQLESNKPFNADMAGVLFYLIKFAEEMTVIGNNKTLADLKEGMSHSLTFLGGDSAYHTSDLTKMTVDMASKLIENWKKSLKFSPAVLENEMRLVPISEIAKKLGQNYTTEINRATRLLFNSELKYVPPKRTSTGESLSSSSSPGLNVLAREDTPLLNEILKMQQLAQQRFMDGMMEMQKLQAASEERQRKAEEERRKWEMQRYKDDQEFKRLQLEASQKQEAERQRWMAEIERKRQEQEDRRMEMMRLHQQEMLKAQEAADRRNAELLQIIAANNARQDDASSSILEFLKTAANIATIASATG